jgi:hypothetical protein
MLSASSLIYTLGNNLIVDNSIIYALIVLSLLDTLHAIRYFKMIPDAGDDSILQSFR